MFIQDNQVIKGYCLPELIENYYRLYLLMTSENTSDLLPAELEITDSFKLYLLDLSRWAKFLSVIGFMWCSLLFTGAVGGGFYISKLAHSGLSSFGQAVTAVFILFAVMWFYPCIYLNKFSNDMYKAVKDNNQEVLEEGLVNLKSAFRLFGIVTGIILTLWIVIFFLFFFTKF